MSEKAGFRPEIEGLRAMAALLVGVYHVWMGRVSGGVDVFFVVSGMLITAALMRQIEKGKFSPMAFWSGLIRRLFPMAFLVLAATLLASWLWLPKSLWLDTTKQILASALYLENWKLALNAVDYLARDEPPSPVQQFWALSIQGQFYLLWPFIIGAAGYLGMKRRISIKMATLIVLSPLFILSLLYSVYLTRTDQPYAYFNTFTRAWEFAIGSFLAIYAGGFSAERTKLRDALGWIGLLAIVSCGLVLPVSSAFPGYAALWPVLGAVLVLTAPATRSGWSAPGFLSSALMVRLGGISYAFYLWHWPILIFYRHRFAVVDLSIADGIIVLGTALILAAVSTVLVERPLRRFVGFSSKTAYGFAFGALIATPVVLVSYTWNDQIKAALMESDHGREALNPVDYPGALSFEPGFKFAGRSDVPLAPDFFQIKNDLPASYRDGCHLRIEETVPKDCTYGDKDSSKRVMLVGGSHAAHWLPALSRIADNEGWALLSRTKSGCLFSADEQFIEGGKAYDECNEWNDMLLKEIESVRPFALITNGTKVGIEGEAIPKGYLKRWEQVRSFNVPIVLLRDTPRMPVDAPTCVDQHGKADLRCSASKSSVLSSKSPLDEVMPNDRDVYKIDMTEYFCGSEICSPVAGNIIVYHDSNHISATYAETLSTPLHRKLSALVH